MAFVDSILGLVVDQDGELLEWVVFWGLGVRVPAFTLLVLMNLVFFTLAMLTEPLFGVSFPN